MVIFWEGSTYLLYQSRNVVSSQCVVCEGGWRRRITGWRGLVRSIFHSRLFTVSEGTSLLEWLSNFLYQPRDIVTGYWCALASPCTARIAPLPRERVDMPRVGHCFVLLVSVLPPRNRVVRPRVDRCFGILVLYRKEKCEKLFTCHSTRHLVGVPANNAYVLLRMRQFCIKCPPLAWLSNINFV